MYKELRKEAKKKVEAKMAFYICAIAFSSVSIVLLMLSFYMPSIGIWLKLPIPIFMMVLAILYLFIFGYPNSGGTTSENWREEAIEREMIQLYQQKKAGMPPLEDLSETEVLELKELERLKRKWDRDEDFV